MNQQAMSSVEELRISPNGPVRRAESEEERRARRDRLEAGRRGMPEVDLVGRLGAVEKVREPAEVGVGDEGGGGDVETHELTQPPRLRPVSGGPRRVHVATR